jgi:hypothetical protein
LLASVDISTRAPWIMLNEQHIMACTSTKLKIVLECKIPHELDALKWKAIGRRRRREFDMETRSRKPKPSLTTVGIRCADHATPSVRKSWH